MTHLRKLAERIDKLKTEAEEIVGELQEHFDDKSEKWQEGDAGQAFQEKIDAVQALVDECDTAYGSLTQE